MEADSPAILPGFDAQGISFLPSGPATTGRKATFSSTARPPPPPGEHVAPERPATLPMQVVHAPASPAQARRWNEPRVHRLESCQPR